MSTTPTSLLLLACVAIPCLKYCDRAGCESGAVATLCNSGETDVRYDRLPRCCHCCCEAHATAPHWCPVDGDGAPASPSAAPPAAEALRRTDSTSSQREDGQFEKKLTESFVQLESESLRHYAEQVSAGADELLNPPVQSLVSATRQHVTVIATLYALEHFPRFDVVEAGVFHGGTTVLMARALRAVGDANGGVDVFELAPEPVATAAHRPRLWACDSFEGLPRAQAEDGSAAGCTSEETDAQETRRRSCLRGRAGMYRSPAATVDRALRDEGLRSLVHLVPGWFHQSLPPAGMGRIGFLRIDGDTFNGTYEALQRLYPLLAHGAPVYVDDYGSFRGAKRAVDAFRRREAVPGALRRIHEPEGYYEAVLWCKGDGDCGPALAVALSQ